MTLVEFLMARLDEDEAASRSADDLPDGYFTKGAEPYRVLRDVEAKRAIVKRLDAEQQAARRLPAKDQHQGTVMDWLVEDVLGAMAGVYSDHPDYSPAWRP